MTAKPETMSFTVQVPAERAEAFRKLYRQFMTGDCRRDAAIRQQAADRNQGIASLRKLVEVALGTSGQCRYIARFLAALYNGPRFRFDPADLRGLDTELFEHCMAVLRMDHRCEKEVHTYFVDGSRLWEGDLIRAWDLDGEQLRFAVERLVSELGGKQSDHHLADAIRRRFRSDLPPKSWTRC
jgi:hypothetical protein